MRSTWPKPTRDAGKSQENVSQDFLLPLGLESNHGYGKTPIGNEEVAKKRAAFEKQQAEVEDLGKKRQKTKSVQEATPLQRIFFMVSGAGMNFIGAFVLLVIASLFGQLVPQSSMTLKMPCANKAWNTGSGMHRSSRRKPSSTPSSRSDGSACGTPPTRAARKGRKRNAMPKNRVISCEPERSWQRPSGSGRSGITAKIRS